MNMQTIQIAILLLDTFIKLAPWRTVTEAMGRIGRVSSEGLARRFRFAVALFAGPGLIALAPIYAAVFEHVGSGRIEILNASPRSKIAINLDVVKPLQGHGTAEFAMVPERAAAAARIVTSEFQQQGGSDAAQSVSVL
jgi:hypothetical protein